jgi:hypothetical protein
VPRQQHQVNVHVDSRLSGGDRGAGQNQRTAGGREPSGQDNQKQGDRGRGDQGGGDQNRSGQGGSGRGRGGHVTVGARSSAGGGSPQTDLVKTRTKFTAQHESEAKTQSWTNTEETSHTRSSSASRTDGVSVGDEVGYELVYDHKVHPETLMALPEDQMLVPHIVESPGLAAAVTAAKPAAKLEGKLEGKPEVKGDSKMVALVIDPAVVGGEQVAPVRPGEIPAFEPPVPAVSPHVPDYESVTRPAILRGDD